MEKTVKNALYDTDVIVEAAQGVQYSDMQQISHLQGGIIRRTLELKDKQLAASVGKPMGRYVIYDLTDKDLTDDAVFALLVAYLSKTLQTLTLGYAKRKQTVLVVGLGNGTVEADALGELSVSKIEPTRIKALNGDKCNCAVCTFSPSVYGATGIDAAESVRALVRSLSPSVVIAIDALSSASSKRIGASFQLSDSGIVPGSGVGGPREKIDRESLGVPVISFGVPVLLSARLLLKGFVRDYDGKDVDEVRFQNMLSDRGLLTLSLVPKDVSKINEAVSSVIASAVNIAFG